MDKLIRLLYLLVPIGRFRDRLIRTHFAAGRDGLPEAGGEEDWAAPVRPPDWISREAGYWPAIQERMRSESRMGSGLRAARPAGRPAGLAVAAGGLLAAAILAALFVIRPVLDTAWSPAGMPDTSRVEVLSAEVAGRPARSSIYQMKSASFIWFYPAR
jgi:hypothetical protein